MHRSIFALLLFTAVSAGQETRAPTADEVRALKAGFESERKSLVERGYDKRFLPSLLSKAEEIAKKADAALAGGRLMQASEGFRQARWQLPYHAPQVPAEHVARVLGNLRLRHDAEVNSVVFSPDGKLLASASRDRTVKLWDLGNGHELRSYLGHSDDVRSVAFSPNGKLVASGGFDGEIKLWDPTTAKDIRSITGKGGFIVSLVFSPDGRYVISGQAPKTGKDNYLLCVNEVESGKLHRSIEDFRLPPESLAFNHDGTVLAVGSGDGQVRLWEYPALVNDVNRPAYWTQQDTAGATYQVAISPDNKTLARCGPDGVKLYNLPRPEVKLQVAGPRRILPPPSPLVSLRSVAFSKDSKTLFTGGSDGLIRLYDQDTGIPAGTFKGHNGKVRSLAFHPGGSQLASASEDYTIRLWDFDIVVQAREFAGHDGPVWKAVLSSDGQRIASASADHTVRIWEVAGGKVLHTLTGHRAPVSTVQFSPNGQVVASAGGDKVVKLWDASSGKLLRDLEGHQGTVTGLDFFSDGKRIASIGVDRRMRVWDAASGKELLAIDNGAVPAALSVRSDGQQIAVGNVDQTIRLYEADSGKTQANWTAHAAAVSGLAYSPDGKSLASCGVDQLVRIWPVASPGSAPVTLAGHNGPLSAVAFRKDNQHVASCGSDLIVKLWRIDNNTGKEAQNYRGHRDWVTSVNFSKDGFYLISSGVDRSIKMWEITSRDIPLLSEHTGAVQAVAVSPDGKIVASGATDRTIKLWDRTTGVEIVTLAGHTGAVSALVFSNDGKLLLSGSEDRSLKLWDVTAVREVPREQAQQQNWSGLLSSPPLMSLTPDGKKLFVWEGGNERFIKINAYEFPSGNQLFTFNDNGRHVQAVSISADGKTAATAAKDGSIRLFDLDKNGQMMPGGDWFPFEKDVATGDIALTPDGSQLVVTSEKGQMKILKLAGRQTLQDVKAHAGHINACLVSPDGKRVATAGADNQLKLWDVASGKELRRWSMQESPGLRRGLVVNVAFSPDSKQLVTGNANTTLFVLDLP